MNETGKNSILVVDDEHANSLALIHILSPLYTVYAEKNGQDAIETARELLPDLILLDILMPEMNGYEVLSVLKNTEETKNIPVIFITGLKGIEDEEKGLSLGAADYITKPFSPDIVELRVKNQINLLNQMRLNIEKERNEKNDLARIEFLTRMSHEMLTPMNAIMGIIQIIRMQTKKLPVYSDDIEQSFNEYNAASGKLLGLIHYLLDLNNKNINP